MLKIIYIGIILLCLDFIYLTITRDFFKNQIEKIQFSNMKVTIFSAIITYIILIYGLNYFIISKNKSVYDAFILGIIIYGVYETTNYAIFKNWSIKSVILDTIWGGILLALTTKIIYYNLS